MATLTERIGKKIRALRKKKGLSQEQLAYESGLDYSYLNQIEAGKRNLSVKSVARIAKALGVKIEEIVK